MARDTLNIQSGVTPPAGMNDNMPLSPSPAYYNIQGAHSKSQLFLERMEGKTLLYKFHSPVLAIHGDLRGRVIIETKDTLYMFDHLTDAIPV